MQKMAFQEHKNNIRNNKFRPKKIKFLINIKNEKNIYNSNFFINCKSYICP